MHKDCENEKLTVLLVSQDKEAALHMAFMYATNSLLREWWKEVELIIWGPSVKLVIGDEDIQHQIAIMQNVGVKLFACVTCADRYGVADQLRALNIEVIPMGKPLTETLKNGGHILTV